MSLRPIRTAQRPSYPRRSTRLPRSLRRTVIAAAVPLISMALGCASAPPGVPETPSTSVTSETPSDRQAQGTEEWVQVRVHIIFEARDHDLDAEDEAILREIHLSLVSRTDIIRVRVEGYTHDEPDETESRLALSRAQAVVAFFVDELGMRREFFEAVDGGSGDNFTGSVEQAVFRRVEISMLVRRAN